MNLSSTQLLSTLEPVSSVARGVVFEFSQATKRLAGLRGGRQCQPTARNVPFSVSVEIRTSCRLGCSPWPAAARAGFPADRVRPERSSGRSRGGLRWVRAAAHRGLCPVSEAGSPGFTGRTILLCAQLAYVFRSWSLHEAKRPESGISPILGVWKFPLERFLRAQSNPSFVT